MKRIAIIPARGGSKRIPRKNIKDFFGKPIFAYSLECCKRTNLFNKIHISTEDKEIYKLATDFGHKPDFYRSQETASDQASIREVLQEVIKRFEENGEEFDVICLMTATAPLITEDILSRACDIFERSKKLYPLLAVARYHVPIEWALKSSKDNAIIEPIHSELFFKSSQSFEESYYDTGTFAFFTRENLFFPSKEIQFIPYVIPATIGIDIDTMEDWEHTKLIFQLMKSSKTQIYNQI